MKQFNYLVLVLIVLILCGCQSETLPTPTLTMVAERPTITITASPTLRPQLEAEPVITIRSTATEEAELANTPRPTATLAAPTATNFPLPTPINTPIPSATPEPRLPTGDEDLEAPTWVTIGTPLPLAGGSISSDNVSQLVEVGRWGKGAVLEAVYSPDGSRLYVLTQQGIYFYDTATAVQLAFYAHKGRPNHIALSPDGRILAISTTNYPYYHIELRDANNFNFLGAFFPFEQNRRLISKLLFDKSGQYLFIGGHSFSQDGQTTPAIVTAWDVNRLIRLAEVEAPFRFDFAAQADMLVTSDEASKLRLWQWQFETFTEIATFQVPPDMYGGNLLAISPDGQHIALSGEVPDPRIAVWSKDVEEPLYILNSSRRSNYFAGIIGKSIIARPAFVSGPGRDNPSQLLFSPDSQQLAATTEYFDLTFWRVSDGVKTQELIEVGESILFHPTEAVIATWRYTISQWHIDDGEFINVLNQHIGPIADLAVIPGANQLAIASADSYIYLRQIATGDLFGSLKAGIDNETSLTSPSVYGIDITADGQTLVSASNDAYRVWNLNDYSMTTLSPRPRGDIGPDEIAISSNGDYIAGTEYDNEIRLWKDGETVAGRLPLFSPGTVTFSKISPLLATFGYFGSEPVLWDVETEQSIPLPLGDFEGLIEEFVFSADEQFLAGSTVQDAILVWRVDGLHAELSHILSAGSSSTYGMTVAFSNDNQILAQSASTYVRFWNMSDGSLLYSLAAKVPINAMVFSPEGDYLITGHWDGSVRFWAVP